MVRKFNNFFFRYFRSGNELYRMAKVYMQEGNYENAYILFMRFLTLFVEKINEHPKIKEIPANVKKVNKEKMKEIMELTEKLKVKLLERYKKEYEQFLIDQENERKKTMEEAKRKEIEDARNKTAKSNFPNPGSFVPSAPNFAELDQIVYPNDFPTDPQKPSQVPSGLIQISDVKPILPSFDRSTKPTPFHSLMEGGLRTIVIPDDTMKKFLDVARSNTVRNIETCGILILIFLLPNLLINALISFTFRDSSRQTRTP